jgi:hypothetical protein
MHKDKTNTYTVLVENMKELGVDGRIILKQMLKK